MLYLTEICYWYKILLNEEVLCYQLTQNALGVSNKKKCVLHFYIVVFSWYYFKTHYTRWIIHDIQLLHTKANQ